MFRMTFDYLMSRARVFIKNEEGASAIEVRHCGGDGRCRGCGIRNPSWR